MILIPVVRVGQFLTSDHSLGHIAKLRPPQLKYLWRKTRLCVEIVLLRKSAFLFEKYGIRQTLGMFNIISSVFYTSLLL